MHEYEGVKCREEYISQQQVTQTDALYLPDPEAASRRITRVKGGTRAAESTDYS